MLAINQVLLFVASFTTILCMVLMCTGLVLDSRKAQEKVSIIKLIPMALFGTIIFFICIVAVGDAPDIFPNDGIERRMCVTALVLSLISISLFIYLAIRVGLLN